MVFKGYSRIFSTVNNKQYTLIGEFWDELLLKYNIEDLRGLGFNWTDTTIEYVIGLKNNEKINDIIYEWKEINLPDNKWEIVKGKTDELDKIYSEIYKKSLLKYEIEMFYNNGNCEIRYIREE